MTSRLSEEPSYYEILGVPHDAPDDEIKARYKALVLKFHPDRERSYVARTAMILINNAYEVLSDPQRRYAYDISLIISSAETRHGQQSKQEIYPWTVFETWKVPKLILISLAVSFLVGYQIEASGMIDASFASDQFASANRHYFMAILHEAILSLPLCIPVFGVAWGVLGGFNMGLTDKSVITMSSYSDKPLGLVPLYIVLSSIIKMAAYAVGMYQSMILAYSIKIKKFTNLDMMHTKHNILTVVLLSVAAGYVEYVIAGMT